MDVPSFCSLSGHCSPRSAAAQTPPKEPPPLWDVQIGASFIGTSGNSDTSSTGADFALHRRWPVWQIEATATAVKSSTDGTDTAERYLAGVRGQRKLTDLIGLSTGIKAEHDPLAGMDARTILDAGLSWALVHDRRRGRSTASRRSRGSTRTRRSARR